jgi:hypothetical protein
MEISTKFLRKLNRLSFTHAMKKLVLTLSLGLLILPGCSNLTSAHQEASEAILNVSNEAIRIKNNVETTATQVKGAIESVNSALTATQDAIESVQEIGDDYIGSDIDETENDEPSLSSED